MPDFTKWQTFIVYAFIQSVLYMYLQQHLQIYSIFKSLNIHFYLINIEETKFQVRELVQSIFFLSVIFASGGTKTLEWKKNMLYTNNPWLFSS